MLRNTTTHYGSISKFFHWLMFFFILGMLCVGTWMAGLGEDNPMRDTIYLMHKSTGLLVLAFALARILWALSNPKPMSAPGTSAWERFAERSAHFILYLLMVAMPLSGWVMSTAAGHAPNFYGLFEIATPGIGLNKAVATLSHTMHVTMAWIIVTLVSLHVLAALWHHYIRKDNILLRMMPGYKG